VQLLARVRNDEGVAVAVLLLWWLIIDKFGEIIENIRPLWVN